MTLERSLSVDPVMVLRVIDGDTLEVRTEVGEDRLRLKGVDTPEMGRRGEPAEPLLRRRKRTFRVE